MIPISLFSILNISIINHQITKKEIFNIFLKYTHTTLIIIVEILNSINIIQLKNGFKNFNIMQNCQFEFFFQKKNVNAS